MLIQLFKRLASHKTGFFEKFVIIDDVDSKLPFSSGIFEAVGAQEKRFSHLIISYVARIYMNKGENMPVFFV